MESVFALSFVGIVLYSMAKPKKVKPHPPHTLLQSPKFRAIDSFYVPPVKYVIPDAAYEYAERQISQISQIS